MESDLIIKASAFAIKRHGDQKRKYTGEPYWHHLKRVANLVWEYGGSEVMVAAAWLHDTVEDTDVTLDEIKDCFGDEISNFVYFLTQASKPTDGNRAKRKKLRDVVWDLIQDSMRELYDDNQ